MKTGEPKDNVGRGSKVPFPLNPVYVSTPVVSDELANEVFRRVTEVGKSVRVVSAELGVTMERVAAIVRLKTIERNWEKQVSLLWDISLLFPCARGGRGGRQNDESN